MNNLTVAVECGFEEYSWLDDSISLECTPEELDVYTKKIKDYLIKVMYDKLNDMIKKSDTLESLVGRIQILQEIYEVEE